MVAENYAPYMGVVRKFRHAIKFQQNISKI